MQKERDKHGLSGGKLTIWWRATCHFNLLLRKSRALTRKCCHVAGFSDVEFVLFNNRIEEPQDIVSR